MHVDNMRALFMAENVTSNQRAYHIDVRHRFFIDLMAEGSLDAMFTNSANNTSNVVSKNVSKEVYQRHTAKFLADKSILDRQVTSSHGWGLLEMSFQTVLSLAIVQTLNLSS